MVHVVAVGIGKHQTVSPSLGVGGEVGADLGEEVRKDSHGLGAGGGLGSSHFRLTARPGHGAPDSDEPMQEVDVLAAQFGEFPEPQGAPSREMDHQSVSVGHGLGDLCQLDEGGGAHAERLGLRFAGATDTARVAG